MDLLPYVVDLMLEVADLNLKVPDLRSTEIRLTLTPARRLSGAWFSRLYDIWPGDGVGLF